MVVLQKGENTADNVLFLIYFNSGVLKRRKCFVLSSPLFRCGKADETLQAAI